MKRYAFTPIEKSENNKRIYTTTRYPEVPRSYDDIYVYTTVGDRYDTLASQYYGNPSLWWVISSANGTINQDSLIPPIAV